MNSQQPWNTFRPRAAISVSSMATAVGLSRSQFYAYVKRGCFPSPVYSLVTRRPFFTLEQQQEIVEVRATGVGINGEYILFYERRTGEPSTVSPVVRKAADNKPLVSLLLDSLMTLGLSKLRSAEVEGALSLLYPAGTAGKEVTELLQPVYRHLRRQGHS